MSHKPEIAPIRRNKKALILPGGGMRVAYQAGAIQRLAEEGLRYSYADGTSGGLMNLGALLSGVAPAELAMRWRSLRPTWFISPLSLRNYLRFPNLVAFGDFDGITGKVFPHLGIDPEKIRASTGVTAQFNICEFDEKIVVPVAHDVVEMPHLLAGMSLPMFTPAVKHAGKTWTDAVWIKDSNMLKCVENGANELWVIWCIGNDPNWKKGTLNQYVHMIEMSAVAHLNAEMAQISALNIKIADGEKPFGHSRPIKVHVIRPDLPIPLDPDFVSGKVSSDALVNQGYMDAANYLANKKTSGSALDGSATKTDTPAFGVTFREQMAGRITFGETDPVIGGANVNAIPLKLFATINIRDIIGFRRDPQHRADMAAHIYSPRLGFILPATHSNFQLFSPTDDPNLTQLVYEIGILIDGKQHWLSGRKDVRHGPPWQVWRATTTLYVRLFEGRDANGKQVAAGVMRLGIFGLLSLLATLRSRDTCRFSQKTAALAHFAGFFTAALWRTYIWRGRKK